MGSNEVDWQSVRKELAERRTELFDRFEKNPKDTHLAIEIKHLDDQMLDCSEHEMEQRGAHPQNPLSARSHTSGHKHLPGFFISVDSKGK